jgi:hypothetical protein
MRLFPRTAADWTRSLAYPLFGVCVVLLLASTVASFGGDRVWKYAGGSIGGVLLPSLGLSLGLTCLLGKGLDRKFRKTALIVAGLSVIYGPMLMPALA